MIPFKSTAEELLFEWSHHRIRLQTQKIELHYIIFHPQQLTYMIILYIPIQEHGNNTRLLQTVSRRREVRLEKNYLQKVTHL